jgi:hypothetical protein
MLLLAAVAVFAAITFGLGWTALSLSGATRPEDPLTRLIETAGVGIAAFSLLAVFLKPAGIPLTPAVYAALAAVGPVWRLARRALGSAPTGPRSSWKSTADTPYAAGAIVLTAVLFGVYHSGATAYPYLEDDDSWLHAQAVLYVAKTHTYEVDPLLRQYGGFANYLEPYPPTYDVLLGLMRQIDGTVHTTLKFFNVTLVALAHLFCFLCCAEYMQSKAKGLFATLVLVALPSFMSHFIWSQSLALCVFPVALYSGVRALSDRSWIPAAALCIGSMMVTQPVVSFVFGVVWALLVACVLAYERGEKRPAQPFLQSLTGRGLLVGASGVALSLVYWGAQVFKWGADGIAGLKGNEVTAGWMSDYALQQVHFWSVVFPGPADSRIDQATGWGPAVTVALAAGLLVQLVTVSPRRWRGLHLLLWFAVLAYVVFAPSFGLPAWGSARAWAYLAIPLAMLTTEGVFAFLRLAKSNPALERPIVVGAAIAIVATSAPAKIELQTVPWSPGRGWTPILTPEGSALGDLPGYVALRNELAPGTRLYSLCGDDGRAIGFDFDASPWVAQEAHFRRMGSRVDAEEVLAFLDARGYENITVDSACARDWGAEAAGALMSSLTETGRVTPAMAIPGFVYARVSKSASPAAPTPPP